MADNTQHNNAEEEPGSASPIIMPVAGMPSAGFANMPESSAGSLISPQPFVDTHDSAGHMSLADRVEQTLAEDGRFMPLLTQLIISVDETQVHLSGHIPTGSQKQSLLAAVRAVPGVTGVTDAITEG